MHLACLLDGRGCIQAAKQRMSCADAKRTALLTTSAWCAPLLSVPWRRVNGDWWWQRRWVAVAAAAEAAAHVEGTDGALAAMARAAGCRGCERKAAACGGRPARTAGGGGGGYGGRDGGARTVAKTAMAQTVAEPESGFGGGSGLAQPRVAQSLCTQLCSLVVHRCAVVDSENTCSR